MLRELRAFRLERALEHHAQVGARCAQPARNRAAALERCHRPGAGRHRRRCQPGVARAVRHRGRRWSVSRSWTCSTRPRRRRCKGALAACLQGRWNDHTLKVNAILADGTTLPVELVLALGEHDGEPCVRLVVPARPRDEPQDRRGSDRCRALGSATGLPASARAARGAAGAPGSAARRRHALPRAGQARQVRDRRARCRRHGQRRRADRIREAAEGGAASEGDRRTLRRRAVPRAARARQRARHRGLGRATAGAGAEARAARQGQDGRGDLHRRFLGRAARRSRSSMPSSRMPSRRAPRASSAAAIRSSPPDEPTPTPACSPTTRSGSSTSRRR